MSVIQRHGDWLRSFPPEDKGGITYTYQRISDDQNSTEVVVSVRFPQDTQADAAECASRLRELAAVIDPEWMSK